MREGQLELGKTVPQRLAVTTEGKSETVCPRIGPSEAEPFLSTCLRDLVRRGLKGVKPVISDAREGLKAAINRVVSAI